MLALAEKNKATRGAGAGDNITFVEARITDMTAQLADGMADVIISNCVINLVPEDSRHLVFGEMFRLLRPGGRVAVSDILARKPLPEKLRQSVAAYVGCVAGAGLVADYVGLLNHAGFKGEFCMACVNSRRGVEGVRSLGSPARVWLARANV